MQLLPSMRFLLPPSMATATVPRGDGDTGYPACMRPLHLRCVVVTGVQHARTKGATRVATSWSRSARVTRAGVLTGGVTHLYGAKHLDKRLESKPVRSMMPSWGTVDQAEKKKERKEKDRTI